MRGTVIIARGAVMGRPDTPSWWSWFACRNLLFRS